MNRDVLKKVIYIGLFLVPFVPFLVSSALFFPFITTKAYAFRVIVEVVLASWVLLALIEPSYRPRKSFIAYALITFLVIIGLADLFGIAPVKSFWSNSERMEGFIALLHLGAYFVVMGSVLKVREWKWWWNTSLVAAFLMGMVGVLQLLGLAEIHQGAVRLDGTLGNAGYLAVYMLFHIFIAGYYFLKEKEVFLKWVYATLTVFLTIILYHTATRGALLGLLGGVLIVAFLNLWNKENTRIRRLSITAMVVVAVLVSGFFVFKSSAFVTNSPVLARFATLSTGELKSGGRAFIWPMAIQGIKERPLLGWGQENFNYIFSEHYNAKMFNLEPWFDRAHNIFLDWGVAGGLLGLLSYLSLYLALILSVWKKEVQIDFLERSVLSGLLAAYFFHNFFVFDHLASYILFFALLAYMHSRVTKIEIIEDLKEERSSNNLSLPVAVICLGAVLYFVNIKPIVANHNLINGFQGIRSEATMEAGVLSFQDAYTGARLGRPEVVEWISSNAPTILQSGLPLEKKNEFYNFARGAVERQAKDLPTDPRYQMIAGSFLLNTGQLDEGIAYLKRAIELIPNKQTIYFELGSAYIAKGDYKSALETLKKSYELAPEYTTASLAYLTGAIYAGDRVLQQSISKTIAFDDYVQADNVVRALFQDAQYNELIKIFNARIKKAPTSQDNYTSLAVVYVKMGNYYMAIQTLNDLGKTVPSAKAQADDFVKQIQNGTLR